MGGKTTKHTQPLRLEHAKAAALQKLADNTGISKADLLREAVDDLLRKYRKVKKARKP